MTDTVSEPHKDIYLQKLQKLSLQVSELQQVWQQKNGGGSWPFMFGNILMQEKAVDRYFVCEHVGCKCRVIVRNCQQGTPSCKEHQHHLTESMNVPMSEDVCWVVELSGVVTAPKKAELDVDG